MNFFNHHTRQYITEVDVKGNRLANGVPPIPLFAITLWMSMYHGILQLIVSDVASIVGFVDDFVLFIINRGPNTSSHSFLASRMILKKYL